MREKMSTSKALTIEPKRDVVQEIYEVKIELGHRAHMKPTPTPDGYTHDWTVFVRGAEGNQIEHFVEKVVFHLHDSFPKPKRAVKEPPYTVSESGYAGFIMPIEVYFRSKEEPKKVKFVYDLYLSLGGVVNNIRLEKMTFSNPVDEFREKLLRGGGQQAPLAITGSSVSTQPQTCSTSQNADSHNPKQSIAAKKPKPPIPSKDPQTKPSTPRPPSPPSTSLPAPTALKPPSQPFTDIFGAPIRAKSSSSSDLPSATVKAKVTSHSKGKIAPGSTSTSSTNKESKPVSKDPPDRPPKEGHSSVKESRHISKDSQPSSKEVPPHHTNKEAPRVVKDNLPPVKETHHSVKEPHRTVKESQKSPKDSSSKEGHHPSKSVHHSSKEVRHHTPKDSHHASKEPRPIKKEPHPSPKEPHSVNKDSQHSSKEQHTSKEVKHSKEGKHTSKETPRAPKEPHNSSKDRPSSKESKKVFKEPYPAKESHSTPKEVHRPKNTHVSSKEAHKTPNPKEGGAVESKETKIPSAKSFEKVPKRVKRITPDSHTHGQSEKKKKKPNSPPPEAVKPPPVVAKPKVKDTKEKSDERRIEPHISIKKEKETPRHSLSSHPVQVREIPKPKPPSPVQKYSSPVSSDVDSDSEESKKSSSIRAQYSSPASSISETSLDGSHPYSLNSLKESEILSPMMSDSDMSLSPPNSPKHKSSSESPPNRPLSRMSSESPLNSPLRRLSSESPHHPLKRSQSIESSPLKRSPSSESSQSSMSRDSESSDSEIDVESPDPEPEPEPQLVPVIDKRHHDHKHSKHKSAKHPHPYHHHRHHHHHHQQQQQQQQHYQRPHHHYHHKNEANVNNSIQGHKSVTEGRMAHASNSGNKELLLIQRKIMGSQDRDLLQKIVDVIEAAGKYEISKKTFDFDLLNLDSATLKKVKYIVYSHL